MKPASARWRPRAFAAIGCARRTRGGRRRSPRARRRRTCPGRCGRAPRRLPPPRRPRAPRPPARRCARRAPAPPRRCSRSTESSGFISVGSGFIAARTTTGSPFVIPASRPPAWFVRRTSPGSISSCASDPRTRASAKPSPTSTPFTAWIPIRAKASRASSRSDFSAYEPRPGGQPSATTSTMPPSVSRSLRAASVASRMPSSPRAPPTSSGRPATVMPIVASSALATEPAATCVAVWRALARSSALRTSSWPYLSTPARSAWPGRGRVTGFVPLPVRVTLGLPRAHPPGPVLVVEIADDERQRRSERECLAETREHLDGVGLELLARAAAVAELAPPQVGVDRGAVEPEARGQAGEHGHERGSVRLSCGDEAECHAASLEGWALPLRFVRVRRAREPRGSRAQRCC